MNWVEGDGDGKRLIMEEVVMGVRLRADRKGRKEGIKGESGIEREW